MADDELRTVLGQIFDLLDADKSGHIEEAEGLAIAHHMGSSDKVAFWESMIRDMDTDGDGKISKLEYIDFNVSSGMKLKGAQMLKTELMDKGFNGSGIPPATMDSVERVLMSKLLPAIEAAHAAGKTPILVDATDPKKAQDFSPLETFLSYSGHEVFEAKKMVVEVNMKKEKSLEDAREEQRVKLCRAMKHGTYFIIAMSNGAPPWKKKFCDDESLPLALFDGAAVNSVSTSALEASGGKLEETWAGKVIKSIDECAAVNDKFKVVVVTKFAEEDYVEFLQAETPLEQMAHMVVTAES